MSEEQAQQSNHYTVDFDVPNAHVAISMRDGLLAYLKENPDENNKADAIVEKIMDLMTDDNGMMQSRAVMFGVAVLFMSHVCMQAAHVDVDDGVKLPMHPVQHLMTMSLYARMVIAAMMNKAYGCTPEGVTAQ